MLDARFSQLYFLLIACQAPACSALHTMLNLLHVRTSPNHGSCFTVLTRDPFTFVDPFDPLPMTR